jgi:hypothetical protein
MDQKILKQLEQLQKTFTFIETNMFTKDDMRLELAKYPTKNDLKNVFEKQAEDFDEIVNVLFVSTDKRKADKKAVVELDKRVTQIEINLAA